MALHSAVKVSFILVVISFIFVSARMVPNEGKSHSANIPEVDLGLVHSREKRGTSGSRLTFSERLEFLSAHNNFRRNVSPTAANMRFMVWSEELASMAQEWADGCVWRHGFPVRNPKPFYILGQNLEYTTVPGTKASGSGSTTAWHDEVSHYTFASMTCAGVCGHYTQLVWANSYALGCAVNKCDLLANAGARNALYTVCMYGPGGNFYGRPPYEEGVPCSDCPFSTTCENKLCVNSTSKCSDKTCLNGGTLDNDSCECNCPSPYYGKVCGDVGSSDSGDSSGKGGTTHSGASSGKGVTTHSGASSRTTHSGASSGTTHSGASSGTTHSGASSGTTHSGASSGKGGTTDSGASSGDMGSSGSVKSSGNNVTVAHKHLIEVSHKGDERVNGGKWVPKYNTNGKRKVIEQGDGCCKFRMDVKYNTKLGSVTDSSFAVGGGNPYRLTVSCERKGAGLLDLSGIRYPRGAEIISPTVQTMSIEVPCDLPLMGNIQRVGNSWKVTVPRCGLTYTHHDKNAMNAMGNEISDTIEY